MIVIFALIIATFGLRSQKNVFIESVDRKVDLKGRYNKYESIITLQNQGIVAVEKFYHIVHQDNADKLYYIGLLVDKKTEIRGKLIQDQDAQIKYNSSVYEFTFKTPVGQGDSEEFTLVEWYYNRYEPLPKQIKVEDNQNLLFSDNVYFFTPYNVKTQQTQYITERIISYSLKQVLLRNNVLEYGPYQDIKPFSHLKTKLHLENNSPLVTFTQAIKTVELSHWGNILIEEQYTLRNEGARIDGEFSRVTFNKYASNVGQHSIKSYNSYLPIDTWGIYYRDEIGNISTSNAARVVYNYDQTQKNSNGENTVLVQLRPRFAVFGGWKANFVLGYNLPTKKYLENDGDLHVLTQNFAFSIKDIIAEEYTLKIILPEGCTDVKWILPFQDIHTNYTLTHSYLDTTGRPTYIFTRRLTSYLDNVQFKIQYDFTSFSLFKEPFLVFISFLTVFATIIAVRRLELKTLQLKSE
ncbi:hypothetical protein pb186bvf_006546 [Paramecium bursaria]